MEAQNLENEEEICPVCKSTKYLNPKLTLLVSPCYHRLCETCINRLFLHGSAPCPLCGTTLRKGNFVSPTFSDLIVEKEVRIRKIVSKAFYKRLEDFGSLKGYNDYLEEVEDIVFNLVNDVDVQSTYSRLESFKTDNRDVLERNLARLANEQRQALLDEEAERVKRDKLKAAADNEIEKEKLELQQAKQQFIHDLANSNEPAALILAEAQKKLIPTVSASGKTIRPGRKNLSSTSIEPTTNTKRSYSHRAATASSSSSSSEPFDALQNLRPLPPPPSNLTAISDSLLIDLFADLWPLPPSSYQEEKDGGWDVSKQIRAGGFPLEALKINCIRAAYSWM